MVMNSQLCDGPSDLLDKGEICWKGVKSLLLKCHCDVVVFLKRNQNGVLYFFNTYIKMVTSWQLSK